MNYPAWQKIWRFHRASLWSLVGVALAAGAQFSLLLRPPWDYWLIVAWVALLGVSLLGWARAHYVRLRKTTCW